MQQDRCFRSPTRRLYHSDGGRSRIPSNPSSLPEPQAGEHNLQGVSWCCEVIQAVALRSKAHQTDGMPMIRTVKGGTRPESPSPLWKGRSESSKRAQNHWGFCRPAGQLLLFGQSAAFPLGGDQQPLQPQGPANTGGFSREKTEC